MNERLRNVGLKYADECGIEVSGASGILISNDFVLSHGSLLNTKVIKHPEIREFFQNIISGELTSIPAKMRNHLQFFVHERQANNYDFSDNDNDDKIFVKKSNSNVATSVEICSSEIMNYEGIAIVAWKCPLLENTFRELSYGWNFGKIQESNTSLLSIFLIVQLKKKPWIKCSIDEEMCNVRRILDCLFKNNGYLTRKLLRGTEIEISSTPFGNPVFIDSISRGVISNVIGNDGCVLLTDANAVPGSEGAPVYATQLNGTRVYVCGMVIAPLSWCRGEWVDYTFAASLLPCLRNLLRSTNLDRQIVNESETRIVDILDRSLVLVRCGDGWGTGIIFNASMGIVITCSHVVTKAPESRIKIALRCGNDSQSSGPPTLRLLSARMVYRTAKDEPYDVAILKVDPREIKHTHESIKIANDRPILRGETVGSAGFPFFSSTFPTITRGNVSGTNECMLRTTCCIQSGSSGGPIVRWSNGEMLGMVVCNAIATNEAKIYPRLNMAVPVSILEPPISEYLRTGEIKALDVLSSKDPSVKRTWNFHYLPSSKM